MRKRHTLSPGFEAMEERLVMSHGFASLGASASAMVRKLGNNVNHAIDAVHKTSPTKAKVKTKHVAVTKPHTPSSPSKSFFSSLSDAFKQVFKF